MGDVPGAQRLIMTYAHRYPPGHMVGPLHLLVLNFGTCVYGSFENGPGSNMGVEIGATIIDVKSGRAEAKDTDPKSKRISA